jgi:hypothetical protein
MAFAFGRGLILLAFTPPPVEWMHSLALSSASVRVR